MDTPNSPPSWLCGTSDQVTSCPSQRPSTINKEELALLALSDEPVLPMSPEQKRLSIVQFAAVYPRVMEMVTSGHTLTSALRELPIDLDNGAFLRWLNKDPLRVSDYKEAKELRAETWVGRMIDHASASDTMEDVARSKLIVDTYKWVVAADNRRTYGETKQIDIGGTISITSALEQANARITQVIDGEILEELTAPISQFNQLEHDDE